MLEILNMMVIKRGLASMVYKFLDKKNGLRATVNKDLPEEFHKQAIKKFKRSQKPVRRLKKTFGQQVWLKFNHYLLLIIV